MATEQERFYAHLVTMLHEMVASDLLTVPGIYEIVAEEFNNEVLDLMAEEEEIEHGN